MHILQVTEFFSTNLLSGLQFLKISCHKLRKGLAFPDLVSSIVLQLKYYERYDTTGK